jgi:hypothetical protein
MIGIGILALFVSINAQVQAGNPPSCKLNYEITAAPNGITFYPVCSGTQDDWATLMFGDGTEVDLQVAESGEVEPASHFYAYEVRGLRIYTATLLVDNAAFRQAVEIDDRLEPSLTTCSLMITQTQLNSFEFQPLCESDQKWLKLDFGDGAYTMFPIAEQNVYPHSYTYTPQGVASYTVAIKFDDSPLLTETVIIDDRDFVPNNFIFLPFVKRNF